ncbi:hypothetical protein [Devosia sp. MC521]|uniref:hypothetical protein n=1 Tax=Devosia sp. MC521 TaxID=2759954 RepID=UPI0015F94DBB|nr:hypothetical protein [Devosia sp. MC521]MBJ6985914.1 hypothetical protein [Devosia sp. MC521]QMW61291.1 hypothetical protein H4N61_09815 [Devosia sp. MC521]
MKNRVNSHQISRHAADQGGEVALCSALDFSTAEPGAPEWVHLLPVGEILTNDGRGPYRVNDAAELIANSMAVGRLVIDETHANDVPALNLPTATSEETLVAAVSSLHLVLQAPKPQVEQALQSVLQSQLAPNGQAVLPAYSALLCNKLCYLLCGMCF